jgi:hypothetical protein
MGNLIAKIGQNPDFIAFNAHWGFAFFALTLASRLGAPLMYFSIASLALAAVKEFWFDPRYETDQNIWPDGALDFAGYAAGIALALVL